MKRLLIVDDEHHIVNWLADLFEAQDNLDLIILKAYTGRDALGILASTKIDIILLDIKMPGIDGLEVAERILSDWPGCRIIFLTGYNSFDYVYYANKQRNIAYLLKTEYDDEILDAVVKAIESIDAENNNLELVIQAASTEKITRHLLQRDILRDIVIGKDTTVIKKKIEDSYYDFSLLINQPVILLYGKLSKPATGFYMDNLSNHILKSMQVMEQVLYNKFSYALLDYDETTVVWFLQASEEFVERTNHNPLLYIKESFDEIISFFQEKLSCGILLMLNHEAIEWERVYDTFLIMNQYARLSPDLQVSQSFGMVFKNTDREYTADQIKDSNLINKWGTQLNEMTVFLNRGEHKQVLMILRQIILSSRNIKSMHYLPLIGIYQRISSILISHINKYNMQESIATQIGLYPLYFMRDFEDWKEAFAYLEKLSNIVLDLTSSSQMDKNQQLILSIKNYINTHLSFDLTLTTLSDMVNYNSSYVSRLFKQTTGMNLSDYVNSSRINKAKELLISSNDSIRVIAEKVGFDTSQYFSMVFRKEVGLTPSEFKRRQAISDHKRKYHRFPPPDLL